MTYASSTTVLARRRRLGTVLIAVAGILFALWATLLAPMPVHAADDDPYRVSGNVHLDGEPLADVTLTIDGPGGLQTVETDADGKWSVGVPERNTDYVVTLDESSLPDGIAVVDETGVDETPNVKEVTVGPGG